VIRLILSLLLALGMATAQAQEIGTISYDDLPPEAQRTLKLIEKGGPYPYRRDGLIFRNYEGKLPRKARGYYLEFTVPTPEAKNRGARRIVVGRGATANVKRAEKYYSDDHYHTFMRIEP
jgi:ribonuclease T1